MVNTDSKPPSLPIAVLIDSQVFRQEAFRWNSPKFFSLQTACRNGSIRLVYTRILLEEIKALARKFYEQFLSDLQKACNKAGVLSHGAHDKFELLSTLSSGMPPPTAIDEIVEDFFLRANAEFIDLPNWSADTVFGMYFRQEAPFGEGKKKSEFPDAFNLIALREHAKKTGLPGVAISGDTDWEQATSCDPSIWHFSSLAHALEWVHAAELESVEYFPTERIQDLLQERFDTSLEQISLALAAASKVDLGDGRIETLEINYTYIRQCSFWEIRETNGKLNCRVEVEHYVSYNAEITVYDELLENELYDEISSSETVDASVEFQMNDKDISTLELLSIGYTEGLSLRITPRYSE